MKPRTVLALYVALLISVAQAGGPFMAQFHPLYQVAAGVLAGVLFGSWFWPRFRAYAAERGETW